MTILVYHAKREFFRDTTFYGHADIITPERILSGWKDRSMYDYVARVDTDDLDEAYRLTNHISSNWVENKGVVPYDNGNPKRSTSVGDILVRGKDSTVMVVAGCGFETLQAPSA